jgi:hypothetical protein
MMVILVTRVVDPKRIIGKNGGPRRRRGTRAPPPPQWSKKSVLAKQFNIFQVNEYFLLKFCLEAFYDMWKDLIMLLAKIANIAHKPI